MITFGNLTDRVQRAVRDDSGSMLPIIKETIQSAYFQTYMTRDWDISKRTATLTLTGLTATNPIVLPADLIKVPNPIKDDTNRWHFSQTQNRGPFYHLKNWYYADPVSSPLASGTTIGATAGSITVTSSAQFPSTTCVGEYIRIGENRGMYKIATWTSTSLMTLEDAFRGDNITAGESYFEVRPVGTKRINFCNQNGVFVAPSDEAIMGYTANPLPLYNRYDAVLLPSEGEYVFLKAMKEVATSKGWTRAVAGFAQELRDAYSDIQRTESSKQNSMKPPTFMQVHSKQHSWGVNHNTYLRTV